MNYNNMAGAQFGFVLSFVLIILSLIAIGVIYYLNRRGIIDFTECGETAADKILFAATIVIIFATFVTSMIGLAINGYWMSYYSVR